MAFDSAFNCGFVDCITPCAITFIITVLVMLAFHVYMYFKFVKLAKQRFGQLQQIVESEA
jgi:hypothetical protein